MKFSPTAQLERQGTHTLVASAAGVILSLGANVLLSRALGPSGKGVLDLVNTTAMLFSLVLGGSLAAGLTKIVAQNRSLPPGIDRPLTICLLLSSIITFAALFLCPDAAIKFGLLPETHDPFWSVYVSIAVVVTLILGLLRGVLVGFQELVIVNRTEVALKAAYLVMFAALPFLFGVNIKAFALAVLLANTGMLIAFVRVLRGKPRRGTTGTPWRDLVHSSLPLHGANVLFFVTHRADLFFVQAQHGSREVGIYALAVTLTQVVLLASSAFAQPLLPSTSGESDGTVAALAAARVARIYLVGSSVGAVALAAVMSWALPLIFGAAFLGSVTPMLILLPGVIAFGLTNILVSYFFGQGHARYNLGLSITGLIITLVGNLTLTPRFGAIGAAMTSTIAYGVSGIIAVGGLARFGNLRWGEILRPRTSELRDFVISLRAFRL